jgi:hypothetical protein
MKHQPGFPELGLRRQKRKALDDYVGYNVFYRGEPHGIQFPCRNNAVLAPSSSRLSAVPESRRGLLADFDSWIDLTITTSTFVSPLLSLTRLWVESLLKNISEFIHVHDSRMARTPLAMAAYAVGRVRVLVAAQFPA